MLGPYQLLAAAAGAAVLAVAGFGAGVSVERGREAQREVERREVARRFEAENRRLERQQSAAITGAVNESRKREAAARAVAAGARGELDGLRGDLATYRSRLSTATDGACREHASTAAALFEQCARAYQGMAEAADGHASDALMLQEAWPRP